MVTLNIAFHAITKSNICTNLCTIQVRCSNLRPAIKDWSVSLNKYLKYQNIFTRLKVIQTLSFAKIVGETGVLRATFFHTLKKITVIFQRKMSLI